ncbi:MAG: bifunctional diaminohydroxyphosphoribosylaminopyrimidine deaminase/5-amino-6-(5-phosphoribosylamino)uracil reductase RibD [Flavobacteriales bacterium]|nr:bifunctional diaminohydroxyphosphoribosylaminopyrimidine deaminase/5-amino-6-(5-phosphoribosylamino)uracil reductase RibD [Flavobacteriales bacterium]
MNHSLYMQRCLELAQLGAGWTAPNPMVGCVIVVDNLIVGEGYHKSYGGPHAEVNAINSLEDKSLLDGATVYVSLEPCSHFGKTPPCADLLVQSNVKTVVIACRDTNPAVAGKGIDRLKKAGIEVIEGVLEKESRELNKRFFTFHEKQRPYVILKWAQTLDGFLDKSRGMNDKGVNWISQPETKALVHKWRGEEQSILVGRNTIINDNPSLTVRDYKGKNPVRIVIDSQLQISGDVNIYSQEAPTIVFNRIRNEKKENVEWVKIKETSTKNILDELYKRGIISVFVEGGSRTLQYFIIDNVWDEARVIVGNKRFEEGIKAPIINRVPIASHPFGEDMVYYYSRR